LPLNIKNEATHSAAKDLARLRGTSLTKAVEYAVKKALADEKPQKTLEERLQSIREIQKRFAELPVLDNRSMDEIMEDMYDENGLPK
jgi:antitoxin VapB